MKWLGLIVLLVAGVASAQEVTGRYRGTVLFDSTLLNGLEVTPPDGTPLEVPIDIVVNKTKRGFSTSFRNPKKSTFKTTLISKTKIMGITKSEPVFIGEELCGTALAFYLTEKRRKIVSTFQVFTKCPIQGEFSFFYSRDWKKD